MRRPDIAETTRAGYESNYRLYLEPVFGDLLLGHITRSDVRAFVGRMIGDGVNPPTISGVHRRLRAILEWAVDDELIAANPASRIKLPKVARREPRFLDERELRAVADAIEPRFRALILVLGYTGIRIGEAAFLQLRHFDPSHRRILVAGTTAQLDGGRLIRKETKTGVVDAITLPTAISDILAGHVEVFVGWSDASAHLFPGPGGGPLYANNCRRREFATACRKALTPPFPRVHDLRHSAAAIALAHGASERQTADLLGHRSTRLVSERYGHTLPDLQNVLAKRLDASFRTIELEHQRDEGEKGRK